MGYDPRIHHRRSIRLKGYDYSQEGAYFVTVCAQDKAELFGEIRDGQMVANDAGMMVQSVWDGLPAHYAGVDIDVAQLMPNHLHGIIVLYAEDEGSRGDGRSSVADPMDRLRRSRDGLCALSLPNVVERLKSLTTTRYREGVLQRGWPRFRGRVWQRNYHEHIIRNEAELGRIQQYILDNPTVWEYDQENSRGKMRKRGEAWEV